MTYVQKIFIRWQKVCHGLLLIFAAITLFPVSLATAGAKPSTEALLSGARAAFAKGNRDAAMALATRAVEVEPKNALCYFVRGQLHEENQAPAKALSDYDQVLKLDPSVAAAWQNRGGVQFKLGRIKESIADFDKFIELEPQQAPHHWQRGIALYYAGRFADGRKQFESHQTVNSNDVENAVWHFLCGARESGVEKARAALIPIKGDARVPMMEVHALFAGKLKPEDVLKAARAEGSPKSEPVRQLFYAHLYLGLYFEALGNEPKAREHITEAVGQRRTDDYMGDVASVHLQLRWPKENPPKTGQKPN